MTSSDRRQYSLFSKTLASVVEPLTRPVFKAKGTAATRLIGDWEKIVGKEIAKRTQPQKLSFPTGKTTDGTLAVAVENGFATEIQHMQPLILERVAGYFGYRAVGYLTITHTYSPSQPQQKKRVKGGSKPLLPMDSERLAEGVQDEELKEALKSFARSLSGQGESH